MPAVRRRAAALLTAAVLVTTGCQGDDPAAPATSGSPTTPAASTSAPVAAATVRAEVSAGDAAAAAAVLRARLTTLELSPGEPQVAERTITIPVARAVTSTEAAALAQPGRLAFRRVISQLPPDGPAEDIKDGDCAEASYRAELARDAAVGDGDVVACAYDGEAKYILGEAEEYGDVASATVGDSGPVATGEPVVQLTLTDPAAWTAITGRYIGEQLAIVLDGKVQAAPTIESAIPDGSVSIGGVFTAAEARLVAAVLADGPLEAEVAVRAG
jgi:preprotein translocase subunit SecD